MFVKEGSIGLRNIDSLKLKAVAWHLLASLVLSFIVAGWMVLNWFPAPFTVAAGAVMGLIIVISVDMCLGPALTLLLIHSKKSVRENLFDGAIIALLQVSALLYGLWQINLARPAAVVFWQDSFYFVKTADFIHRYGKVPDLSEFSAEDVPVIYARYPLLLDELQTLELSMRAGQIPYEQTSLYLKLQNGLAEIKKSPVNIDILLEKYPELQSQLDQLGNQDAQREFIFSRLHSDYGNYLIVLGAQAQLLGLLKLPM